ncbi:MAG: putative sulfate exporter family transporter [Nitrospirae bacterium]|nr:putative sulfate exporter family transporter [Nitrospirota bacterium]
MNDTINSYIKGLSLTVFIATIAYLFSSFHPALDSLVVAILLGIILGNLIREREPVEKGIKLASRVFIPLGITLYGSQLNFYTLLPYYNSFRVIFLIVIYFTVILWLSRRLSKSKNTGLLIACGSVICGASAIVVLSPVIAARKEETSISLISITIVGLTGVIFYPAIQGWFSIPLEPYAFLCGSTLQQIGQVKLAASVLGVFNEALQVKLLRVAMLAPLALTLSLTHRKVRKEKSYYAPWFILTFILTAILFNIFPALSSLSIKIEPLVRFIFSIAIASIGLSIDLDAVIEEGPRPLIIAFLGWIAAISVFTAIYFFTGNIGW